MNPGGTPVTPQVPVITLAGTVNLTELLPELPLPTVVDESRSLLFHPRVAEEAQRHLSCQDKALVSQLAQALACTSADHIELKSQYSTTSNQVDHDTGPPLLQAVLECNPSVFGAAKVNHGAVSNAVVNHVNNVSPLQTPSVPNHVVPNVFNNIPVVKLRKLSEEDFKSAANNATSEHSLKRAPQEQPKKLSRSGRQVKSKRKAQIVYSDDDVEDSKKPVKYFKSREKEREEKKRKDKVDKKRSRAVSDDDYDPDHCVKKMKSSYEDHEDSDEENLSPTKGSKVNSGPSPKKMEYNRKKLERRIAGVSKEKISSEELMETGVYQRFTRIVEKVFDSVEDVDLNAEMDEDGDIPQEYLIPKYDMSELCSETAKLKSLGAMALVPPERMVRLLNILEKNIRDGSKITPIVDDEDNEDDKLYVELVMERILRSMDAVLTTMYILTSENMSKRVYLEDVIEKCIQFAKFQLNNTIYPSFDPVYRIDNKKEIFMGSMKKKRAHVKNVRDRNILSLYNKLHEAVSLIADLLSFQKLDTSILFLLSLGVAPFFVENIPELQLSSLRLVTQVFSKYDKHRTLLLDDILASIARLPSSKRSLRTYRLNSDENIQMLTALVLQLIQCVVELPEELSSNKKMEKHEESKLTVDRDVLVSEKYKMAVSTAYSFLSVFLEKTGNKNEEIDYRPLFENFVQDLLLTVNKPEWPASELLLSILGSLLVNKFSKKSTDVSLRISSLDCLGIVAARLRRDAVTSQLKVDKIDQIIREVKEEENTDLPLLEDGAPPPTEAETNKKSKKKKSSNKHEVTTGPEPFDEEEERTIFLQRVLLDWLAVNADGETALLHARHFYISQWYKDSSSEILRQMEGGASPKSRRIQSKKKKKKRKDGSSDEESDSDDDDNESERLPLDEELQTKVNQLSERRKQFLLTKVPAFPPASPGARVQTLQTHIDYESAELITRYLASKRSFSQSFDRYLQQILFVLSEPSIAVRTKAMKCLTMVVEADPAVLGRSDMQKAVKYSCHDQSTSVREAALDLVGKFALSRAELIDKYYELIAGRILDTGVSVRKRVIKIMKDVCLEYPDFSKIPEICVKMIRRINDEEGIKKLVQEVFQNMWFTPVKEKSNDNETLLRKVSNIAEVVTACKDTAVDFFEQLLLSMFRPKEDKEDVTKVNVEPPKALVLACKQIVDCLVNNILVLEEKGNNAQAPRGQTESQRLVACLKTLYLFAKIRPQLLVNHAITLQPYLSLKCQTKVDYGMIGNVARTLELVVPLMEHPSETFLAQLEEDAVKLILLHEKTVITSCLALLGSIINTVTQNYKLIRDCFNKYYSFIVDYKEKHSLNAEDGALQRVKPFFRRALYTVGLLLRHFDFNNPKVRCGLKDDTTIQVINALLYFMNLPDVFIQMSTLQALGFVCIRHYDLMMGERLKLLYHHLLINPDVDVRLRSQTLENIETYLQEEEIRMIKQDQEWSKMKTKENLKEMCDVQSGMASTIIQLYLQQILECVVAADLNVRQAALKVIQLVLSQGLVHPVQIVPYLVCMSTDSEEMIAHSADKQLQDIEKKYPGFVNMKAMQGFRLSYRLQCLIQTHKPTRGHREKPGEMPGALNGFLYSIMRGTKQQRRAVAMSLLKQFDELAKTSLAEVLFIADNLAYFPYQVIDEPLFIIHHIDVMISVTGSNLLQMFKENLLPPPNVDVKINPETGRPVYLEDDDDDISIDEILSRLPPNLAPLLDCLSSAQNCLLMLMLKDHLKEMFGITDNKTWHYSPSDTSKQYEKNLSKKSTCHFNPKNILSRLKQPTPNPNTMGEAEKMQLVQEYLAFRDLMLKIDREEEVDSDDEGNGRTNHLDGKITSRTQRLQEQAKNATVILLPGTHDGWQHETVAQEQKIPEPIPHQRSPIKTLTIKTSQLHSPMREKKHHRSSSHKKHKKKKKKRRYSDDQDDDSEFSDPDFLV